MRLIHLKGMLTALKEKLIAKMMQQQKSSQGQQMISQLLGKGRLCCSQSQQI